MEASNDDDHDVFRQDFPYHVNYSPFALYSANFYTNNPNKSSKYSQKTIIIGGMRNKERIFHELIIKNGNIQHYNCFKHNYGKKRANLKKFGKNNALDVHSFITRKNEYIITLHRDSGYNVYDTNKDNWLLSENSYNIKFSNNYMYGAKCLFINDKILIVSQHSNILAILYFSHSGISTSTFLFSNR